MTDPADRHLEERLHALARGVSVPVVPADQDVRRGRRRLLRMRLAMAGGTTATLAVVLGITGLTAGDPSATESRPPTRRPPRCPPTRPPRRPRRAAAPSATKGDGDDEGRRPGTAGVGADRSGRHRGLHHPAPRSAPASTGRRPTSAAPRAAIRDGGATVGPGPRRIPPRPTRPAHRRAATRPELDPDLDPDRDADRPTPTTAHDPAAHRPRQVRMHQVLRGYNDVLAEHLDPAGTTCCPTAARSTTRRRPSAAASCSRSARRTAGRTAGRSAGCRSPSPAGGTRSSGSAGRPTPTGSCHAAPTGARPRWPSTTGSARSRWSTPTARWWCSPPTRPSRLLPQGAAVEASDEELAAAAADQRLTLPGAGAGRPRRGSIPRPSRRREWPRWWGPAARSPQTSIDRSPEVKGTWSVDGGRPRQPDLVGAADLQRRRLAVPEGLPQLHRPRRRRERPRRARGRDQEAARRRLGGRVRRPGVRRPRLQQRPEAPEEAGLRVRHRRELAAGPG